MLAVRSMLAAIALVPVLCALPVVYVAPYGNDVTGDGTASNPYRTLARALVAVDPGGTIRIASGAYPQECTVAIPVTIESFGSGRPVLGPRSSPGVILTIAGADDVTLRGVDFAGGIEQQAVRILGGSDRATISDCRFSTPGGASIDATGAANTSVLRCTLSGCALGIRLEACPAAHLDSCAFVDLTQAAVLAVASLDLVATDLRVTRCAQFGTRSSRVEPGVQTAAITLATGSHRAVFARTLVEDCGGYCGADSEFGRYDGLFGIGIDGCDDVVLDACGIHRNEFGGLRVGGGSLRCVVRGSSLVGNGWKNGAGDDVALHATVPSVDARDCRGTRGGPVFDGPGPGNGIAGGALVTLAPIAVRPPATTVATSVALDATLTGDPRARGLHVRDVDGDARDDILATVDLAGAIVLHRRTPAGFDPPRVVTVGGSPVALASGRFDGDPFIDVAVADETGDRVVVLFGDGTGDFPRRIALPTLRRPLRLVAAPLDGTSGDDLVVACAGDVFAAGGTQAMLGDGLGSFATQTLPGSSQPTAVEAIDLEADGRAEVIAYDTQRGSPGLRIWPNLGGGAFGAVVAGAVDPGPVVDAALVKVDLDGFGARDLALARFMLLPGPPQTVIELFRNSGGGGLLGPYAVDTVLGPAELASADLGDRGGARLIAALPALGEVRAYGPFAGTLPPHASYAERLFDRPYPQSVAAGELTGDDAADFVVADGATGTLEIWRGRLVASVERYGAGCTGTLGTPRSLWRSVPELGALSFGVGAERCAASSVAVLLITVLPASIPIDGGCSLLVWPAPYAMPVATDALGDAALTLGVPLDRTLLRGELFTQWWILDPGGAAYATLSASDGLRLRVGG
ncbi:MAG: DUF1565 domain-containing protein [Planctomycetes bacterium]|nr:DUF1565 domain-containing protein [Planctomycetota bacterium]